MDYTDILKRAWRVTWRYKILWVLGIFAGTGAGSGGGGGNSGTSWQTGSNTSSSFTQTDWSQFEMFLRQYGVVIALAVLAAIALGLIVMVLSVAARGGLIHLVNEAEEGRPVKARDGWRVGFAKWWRVFGVGFLAGLPVLLLVLVMLAIVGVSAAAAISSGSTQTVTGTLIAAFIGSACLVIVLTLPTIFLGVVLGISAELGLRYVVLHDRRVMDSLKQGWRDLWSKRGSFLMYLIQIGVGIGFGIVVSIIAVIMVVPGALLAVAGAWPLAVLLSVVAVLLLIVPSAAYSTFYSAVWTIFFRKMSGMEPQPAVTAGVPPTAGPMTPTGFPPAPPLYAAPSAPFAEPPVASPEPVPAEPAAPAEAVAPAEAAADAPPPEPADA
jgi:hypothetical protein